MRVLLCFCLIPSGAPALQIADLTTVRGLYQSAYEVKQNAAQLNKLMMQVDRAKSAAVLICYKGVDDMIQPK